VGTTTTPNMGFVIPDLDEPIPNFALQNSDNIDILESALGYDYGTYNPNWWADSGPDPTLGVNGYIRGSWYRLGQRLVIFYFNIYTGDSGFDPKIGAYSVDLPFTPDPIYSMSLSTGQGSIIGSAIYEDFLTPAFYVGAVQIGDIGSGFTITWEQGEGNWSENKPQIHSDFTQISGYGVYLASAGL
jgi:hypothetical protein